MGHPFKKIDNWFLQKRFKRNKAKNMGKNYYWVSNLSIFHFLPSFWLWLKLIQAGIGDLLSTFGIIERQPFSLEERRFLMEHYDRNAYPSKAEKEKMAAEINSTIKRVNQWFVDERNRRKKWNSMFLSWPLYQLTHCSFVTREVATSESVYYCPKEWCNVISIPLNMMIMNIQNHRDIYLVEDTSLKRNATSRDLEIILF